MRKSLLAVCLFSFSVSVMASCDDLKSQIDAKLQAKGVVSYTLEIVPATEAEAAPVAPVAASGTAAAPAASAAPTKGKIVGSCEGDSKKILYTRH